MTDEDDLRVPRSLQREIQTHHPGIADEIQGAINTLQKLQQIAGTAAPPSRRGNEASDLSAIATTDGTSVLGTPAKEEGEREVPTLAAGESFGRYQIVRLLGRGAMGAVYLAYDPQLARYVALKTPSLGNHPGTIERFYREARATAQLRSPHICPVYDVGQIGGIHYISMAFIEGQSLRQLILDGQLKDLTRIADITRKIARGLQKAHERTIIHRDIKSENIMIDADGEPIVMDFGLAKRLDDDIHMTVPGRIMGTPAYMSPEQVEGDSTKIGPLSDIYSLGVVLYEMLTGRLPFWGSLASVLRQIGNDEPQRPSGISPAVGHDSPLEQICLKMMAKSPAARFPSMAAVAEALEGLSPRGEPPVVRSSVWTRLRSWMARLFTRRTATVAAPSPSAAGSAERTDPNSSPSIAAAGSNRPEATQTVDFPSVGNS
jgi:serine/threonine protein kinase